MSAFVFVALTSQSAQGRCPGGCAEQENHRQHDQHGVVRTHRSFGTPASASVPLWSGVRWRSVQTELGSTPPRNELLGARGLSCDPSWTTASE